MTDEAIIKLYFERDEEALEITEKQYGSYCFTIAHTMLASKEDAEEIVNDTLVRAWNAIPPEKPKSLTAFLGKITRNLALHRLEKKGRNKRRHASELALDELAEVAAPGEDVTAHYDKMAFAEAFNRFLRALPERDCNVFVRRYYHVDSVENIAKRYGISKANVFKILSRTRQKLKIFLQEEGFAL